MYDRIALRGSNNGSRSAVTIFGYLFPKYHGETFSPLVGTPATKFTETGVQIFERTPTSFKVRCRRSVLDFTHLTFVWSGTSPTNQSPYFEVIDYRYTGGGTGGDDPENNSNSAYLATQGMVELTCKFDPVLNIQFARINGIQTAVKPGSNLAVSQTPFENAKNIDDLSLGSLGIIESRSYLVLKIVPNFTKFRSDLESNTRMNGYVSGSSPVAYEPALNHTIGKIISYDLNSVSYPNRVSAAFVLSNIMLNLDTAYTIADAWIAPYLPAVNGTFYYAGMAFNTHNFRTTPTVGRTSSVSQVDELQFTIPAASLGVNAYSYLHKGEVGLKFGNQEITVPLKDFVGQKLQVDMNIRMIFAASTSSSDTSKLIMYHHADYAAGAYQQYMCSVDIANLPFPIINDPYTRYEKDSSNEQRVEVAELVVNAIIGILSNPKIGVGLLDAVMNVLTFGAYNIAKQDDLKAQELALTNGGGGAVLAVGKLQMVTKFPIINAFSFEGQLNTLRDIETEIPVTRQVAFTTFKDKRFEAIGAGTVAGTFYFVKGLFSVTIDNNIFFNKMMADEMARVLQGGITIVRGVAS